MMTVMRCSGVMWGVGTANDMAVLWRQHGGVLHLLLAKL